MSLFDLLAGAGSAAAGYQMAEDIRQTGREGAAQIQELGRQLQDQAAFRGYGVQTGLGRSTISPTGSLDVGVGPQQAMLQAGQSMFGGAGAGFDAAGQALQQAMTNPAYAQALAAMQAGQAGLAGQQAGALGASQQAMQQAMMDTAGREQQVFERAMALQEPGLQRAQAAQQAREFAMGRGGLRGSQFGGTAEDAAMARARAEATNQAAFQAMGQAQQEAMNRSNMAAQFGQLGTQAGQLQGQLGTNLGQLGLQQAQLGQQGAGMLADIAQAGGQLGLQGYTTAFTPLQQQLNALQVGQQAAEMAQTGQLTGAGYGAQLGLGGIQAQINAEKAASELFGNLFGAGMTAIGSIGQGAPEGSTLMEQILGVYKDRTGT
jgi:hypothetical protein